MNKPYYPLNGNKGPAFTPEEFERIAVIAQEHFGLSLSKSKMSLIQSRLRKRMAALELVHFSDYLLHLEGPTAEVERLKLLSVLTTNVTHFFREKEHFGVLERDVLEPLISAARLGQRVRIWSAGCSTGQEAFSIAMTILNLCPEAVQLDIKILATDIDPVVIERAKSGRYSMAEMKGIPESFLTKFVRLDIDGDFGVMGPRLQNLIKFGVYNLIEPLPFNGPFDAIYCRNVAIYFSRETQENLWQALVSVLTPEGYLFVGHSEHVSGPAAKSLTKLGVTSYRSLVVSNDD